MTSPHCTCICFRNNLSNDVDTSTASLSIRLDLVPWILSAALAYGIISFILALIEGGFMPISVANSGGWMARLD